MLQRVWIRQSKRPGTQLLQKQVYRHNQWNAVISPCSLCCGRLLSLINGRCCFLAHVLDYMLANVIIGQRNYSSSLCRRLGWRLNLPPPNPPLPPNPLPSLTSPSTPPFILYIIIIKTGTYLDQPSPSLLGFSRVIYANLLIICRRLLIIQVWKSKWLALLPRRSPAWL